jgi:putative membrane protein
MTLLATFPAFIATFALSLLLLSVFWSVLTFVTPHDEFTLIREGNSAAAVMVCSALLGFALPLAATILRSVSHFGLVVWALVAMAVQIAVYLGMRLLIRSLHDDIVENRVSVALLVGSVSVIAGLLNAAALSV